MAGTCFNCFKPLAGPGPCPHCGYDAAADAGKYPFALRPGSILNGRYVLGRVLGQGGFGITYIAHDDPTGRRVAIKEYYPSGLVGRSEDTVSVQLASTEQAEDYRFGLEQFLAEAQTLAQFMGLEPIVRVYSAFEENGTAYFVMEYLEGKSLGGYLKSLGRPLHEQEANALLMPLMDALEIVHREGVVHRDIAPDNIIVQPDGSVKLFDFGAARFSTGEKSRSLDVVVKHGFAPPEQYMRRGRRGSFTDVYALAATYYYAVTGKIPPDAVDRMQEDSIRSPLELGAELRPETAEVLMQALAIHYADRIQTMAEFKQALEAAAKGRRIRRPAAAAEGQTPARTGTSVSQPGISMARPGVSMSQPGTSVSRPGVSAAQSGTSVSRPGVSAARSGAAPAAPQKTEQKKKRRAWLPAAAVLAAAVIAGVVFLRPKVPAPGIVTETETPVETEAPADPREQRYLDALAALEARDYSAAETALEELGDYADAASRLNEARYGLAGQSLERGELSKAAESFEALGNYEDAAIRARTVRSSAAYLRTAEKGSSVYFGAYEQDVDLYNGAEPIEWILLDRQGDRVLLLSRYGLEAVVFNRNDTNVYYSSSDGRSWLNGDFLQTAFSEQEQAAILATEVDNGPGQTCNGLTGGTNTTDKVFFLRYAELQKYFPDDGTRPYEGEDYYKDLSKTSNSGDFVHICASGAACAPTPYAVTRGARHVDADNCDWWLRTPGKSQNDVTCVNGFAWVEDISYGADWDSICARPALWLDLSAADAFPAPETRRAEQDYAAAEALEESGSAREAALLLRPLGGYRDAAERYTRLAGSMAYLRQTEKGDPFYFGRYDQDGRPVNGVEPIEWVVLERREDKVFLISKYVLAEMAMSAQFDQVGWEESDVRSWLNGTFWQEAFTEEEQAAVLTTEVDNSHSSGYSGFSAGGRAATQDKLFLLSYQEAKKYFAAPGEDGEKAVNGSSSSNGYTSHDILKLRGLYCESSLKLGNNIDGPFAFWWLRSPGQWDTTPAHGAVGCFIGVYSTSYSYTGKAETEQQTNGGYGVRPALWLDLNAELTDRSAEQEAAYAAAAALEESGRLREAAEAFGELGGYRDAADRRIALMARADYLRQAETGESVFFGRCSQDRIAENGPEPIEWTVLDRQDDKVLLLSRYILKNMAMTDDPEAGDRKDQIGWEESAVRAWLNGDFWQTGFTDAEKRAVLLSRVDNSLASGFTGAMSYGGEDLTFLGLDGPATEDHIFLLSYQELKQYFSNPGADGEEQARSWNSRYSDSPTEYSAALWAAGDSFCEATPEAEQGGTYGQQHNTWWWLRTPGRWDFSDMACFLRVHNSSYLSADNRLSGSAQVNTTDQTEAYSGGVRPAIWLDLSALQG